MTLASRSANESLGSAFCRDAAKAPNVLEALAGIGIWSLRNELGDHAGLAKLVVLNIKPMHISAISSDARQPTASVTLGRHLLKPFPAAARQMGRQAVRRRQRHGPADRGS